jgi:hypothetical protein
MKVLVGYTQHSSSLRLFLQVDESDPAWRALAERNEYDIRLYTEVVQLFGEQRELFKSYARSFDSASTATMRVRRGENQRRS